MPEKDEVTPDLLDAVLSDDTGPDDADEALREAFAAAQQSEDGEPPESPAEPPETEPDKEPPEPDKAPDSASQAAEAPDKDGEGDDSEDETPLEPPQDWAAEDHELFHKQPREVQQWILDKAKSFQSDYTQKTEAIAQDKRRLETLEGVLEPIKQVWAMEGMDESQGLRTMIALEGYARQRPTEFIKWFAQARGIDLGQLSGPAPNGQDDIQETLQQTDPNLLAVYQPLHQQLQGLQTETKTLKEELERRRQEAEQREEQQYQTELEKFKSATDEKGAPQHPHYDQVRGLMASYIKDGHAQDLKTAYDMAVHAHPEVSRKIAAAEKARADAEAARERRKHATEARRAGSSITGTPAGSSPRQPKEDAADEVEAVARELGFLS